MTFRNETLERSAENAPQISEVRNFVESLQLSKLIDLSVAVSSSGSQNLSIYLRPAKANLGTREASIKYNTGETSPIFEFSLDNKIMFVHQNLNTYQDFIRKCLAIYEQLLSKKNDKGQFKDNTSPRAALISAKERQPRFKYETEQQLKDADINDLITTVDGGAKHSPDLSRNFAKFIFQTWDHKTGTYKKLEKQGKTNWEDLDLLKKYIKENLSAYLNRVFDEIVNRGNR